MVVFFVTIVSVKSSFLSFFLSSLTVLVIFREKAKSVRSLVTFFLLVLFDFFPFELELELEGLRLSNLEDPLYSVLF